jgi:hypothetical protein
MSSMTPCQNCGKKVGFFERQYKCGTCKKWGCDKCFPWHITLLDNAETSRRACSEACADALFAGYAKRIESNEKIRVRLHNGDNKFLVVMEKDAPNRKVGLVTPPDVFKVKYARALELLKGQGFEVEETTGAVDDTMGGKKNLFDPRQNIQS